MSRPQWVVFDLGETLIDETANWDRWAAYLGVPTFTFHAVLGATISAGRPHTDVFEAFRPGFDLSREIATRDSSRGGWTFTEDDLYADALPTLIALREQGYRLAVIANQPRSAEQFMATLPVDLTATSAQWGVSKPDPAFFARVAETLGAEPAAIAYVGDRVDNDIVPAHEAGMIAVHLRRGPWGYVQAQWPGVAAADLRLDTLTELPAALDRLAVRRS